MKTTFRFVLLMGAAVCGVLRADNLTYTATVGAGGPGQTLYQFTLTNSGDTGGTLFDLFIALPTPLANINTAAIGTPAGWGDSSGGLLFFGPNNSPSTSFVEWIADFNGARDVPIGSSLSGFSFTTFQPITGLITFSLNDSTAFGTAVQAGQPAPEPGTSVMLVSAACAFGLLYLLRRRYA
jgi:hypothetical protein